MITQWWRPGWNRVRELPFRGRLPGQGTAIDQLAED